jgi:hypothetical protein
MYLSAILLSKLYCKDGVNGRHTTWHRASWANELTMAFRRHLSVAFAAGVIGTLGVLMQPAHVAELWRPSVVLEPIPDPPPLPCNNQSWYNADRICLSWTAPRDDARPAATAANLDRSAAREDEHAVSHSVHR